MGNNATKMMSIIFGVFTAVVLIVSQLFYHQNTDFSKKEQKTEKHSEESPDEQTSFFIVASSGPISSLHTQIHQEIIFLFEICFLEYEQHSWTTEVPLALGKYFQTLFHIIISPNAP